MREALVETAWLADHLDDPSLRIVDVRWYLDPARTGRAAYAAGHVPGALFVDVESQLSGPGGRRGGPHGRHPWPAEEHFASVMGAAGVDEHTQVVAYDDQAGGVAARLWFLLRAHGHERAAVLDGGWPKWLAEGRPVSVETANVAARTFVPRRRPELVVDKPAMLARAQDALVLDARLSERYRGEVEPIDPRAGHIPGARSAPLAANLTGGDLPVFKTPAELRTHYAALGAESRDPIVYCGSGVNACHDLLGLHLAGLSGRLYAGSWSEWSSDPELPVAVGQEP